MIWGRHHWLPRKNEVQLFSWSWTEPGLEQTLFTAKEGTFKQSDNYKGVPKAKLYRKCLTSEHLFWKVDVHVFLKTGVGHRCVSSVTKSVNGFSAVSPKFLECWVILVTHTSPFEQGVHFIHVEYFLLSEKIYHCKPPPYTLDLTRSKRVSPSPQPQLSQM